ncbi:MAG TPA: NAD(P)/FAD-dependent oxidoreductase [Anaerolineae bacterium]|nr:NAD(P)/FAD-dependent oxidoreductase [Anaerolineae bacterium]HQK13386.1 NAD(P)/FAD-dependent oxidoreductase [Anaerolineae bacterium]
MHNTQPLDIAIIGAGVTGLSAAYDLLKAGHRVTVYEARPYVGGLAAGFKDEAWEWPLERFYHHIFAGDRDIIGLVNEIGIGDRLFFPSPVTSIYKDGRLYPINKPMFGPWLEKLPLGKQLATLSDLVAAALRVLAFTPIPLPARFRVGLATAYIRYTRRWQPFERVTAHEWLTRAVGSRAYEAFWQPLLEGKFGEDYRQVNMAWFWARIVARSPRLGYFVGGFQGFVEALADAIRAHGGDVRLENHVRGIHPEADGRIRLELRAGDQVHDRVLATCSPQMLKARTPTLPASYTAGLDKLKSTGAVVLVLALKHPVTREHYWINIPKREGFPFLAFVEHTNYIDPRHYGGDHLVYCGDYLPPEHSYFEMEPEAMVELFIPAIQRLNPAFERSWIRKYWKFSEIYAQPVPFLNHSENIPPLQTPIPNLYMANMSQVYPWDRGTNYAVEIGRRAAREMVG